MPTNTAPRIVLCADDHECLAGMLAEAVTYEADLTDYADLYCEVYNLPNANKIDTMDLESFFHDYHYNVYIDEHTSAELVELAVEMGVINSVEGFLAE
jgi:hypothetical protein